MFFKSLGEGIEQEGFIYLHDKLALKASLECTEGGRKTWKYG
jgi:hypothetical protein